MRCDNRADSGSIFPHMNAEAGLIECAIHHRIFNYLYMGGVDFHFSVGAPYLSNIFMFWDTTPMMQIRI